MLPITRIPLRVIPATICLLTLTHPSPAGKGRGSASPSALRAFPLPPGEGASGRERVRDATGEVFSRVRLGAGDCGICQRLSGSMRSGTMRITRHTWTTSNSTRSNMALSPGQPTGRTRPSARASNAVSIRATARLRRTGFPGWRNGRLRHSAGYACGYSALRGLSLRARYHQNWLETKASQQSLQPRFGV